METLPVKHIQDVPVTEKNVCFIYLKSMFRFYENIKANIDAHSSPLEYRVTEPLTKFLLQLRNFAK